MRILILWQFTFSVNGCKSLISEVNAHSSEATFIFEIYAQALTLADVHDFPSLGFPGLLSRPVVFAEHVPYLLVNESSTDIRLPDSNGEGYPGNIRIPAGRIAMAFVKTESGETVSRYEVR